MNLVWHSRDTAGQFLELNRVDISAVHMNGVYVIWRGGNPPAVVRVGQGDIAARLGAHKNDPLIVTHGGIGRLYVTFAAVPAFERDGVESYLAARYAPLVGERFPNVRQIAVNLPF